MDQLFASPVLTVGYVRQQLGISHQGAANLLKKLAGLGIICEQGSGPGIRHRWFCDDVLAVLDPEHGAG